MILIIESSANFPSVAICSPDAQLHFYAQENVPQSHSEKLPVLVQNALNWLTNNQFELQAVAVNAGPGSYTGLRIGVSLAKGICYAKNVPLISVDGLDAMANFVLASDSDIDVVFSMLDARRDEVFLKKVARIGITTEITAQILSENIFIENWDHVAFVGNSNEKAKTLLNLNQIKFFDGPFANQMCSFAAQKFRNAQFENVAYFEPFYLKDFVPGISKKFAV